MPTIDDILRAQRRQNVFDRISSGSSSTAPVPAQPSIFDRLLSEPLPMEGRLSFLPAMVTPERGREWAVPGVLAGAWNAFTAPGRALRGEPVGEDEALNFAMSTVGGGAPMAPAGHGTAGITVWHGSPHKFDAFDMSKIGTGEGAQAYGHGLYFAENPQVAKGYAPRDLDYENKLMTMYKRAEARRDYDSMEVLESAMMHQTPGELRAQYPNAGKLIDQVAAEHGKAKFSLYKVDLPDEHIAKMLDWDKRLNEQSPEVKALLDALPDVGLLSKQARAEGKKLSDMNWPAQDFLTALREWLPNVGSRGNVPTSQLKVDPAAASAFLNQGGIPGNQYLDQGSRASGTGTRNFVVFDDRIPKILSRE